MLCQDGRRRAGAWGQGALRARSRRSLRSRALALLFALGGDTARAACHMAMCPSKAVFEHAIGQVLAAGKRAVLGLFKPDQQRTHREIRHQSHPLPAAIQTLRGAVAAHR